MMKKCFFLLISALFILGACTSKSAKESEVITEERITEVESDTVPKATAILWIDFDLRGNSALGKIVLNVKTKVDILPDGTVNVLEYAQQPSVVVESYIRKTLKRYRVKQRFFEEGSIKPGVQYVYLRMLKEQI